jgi:hypothetical protein
VTKAQAEGFILESTTESEWREFRMAEAIRQDLQYSLLRRDVCLNCFLNQGD